MLFYTALYGSFILTGILLVYGISLLIFALKYSGRAHKKQSIKDSTFSDTDSVDILIPCYNEGESLLEAILSIEKQNYGGEKNIYVLVKDIHDSSIPYLFNHFGKNEHSVSLSNKTHLTIVETGYQGKRDKINFFLPQLNSLFVAFLDADHVAIPSWLEESIHVLLNSENTVAGVQSRRAPKSITKFFQIWDSAQNHIGNELLNLSLVGSGQGVFFTGTTAVFKSNIFDIYLFPDSITEDTYLSYDFVLENKNILYNPKTGSKESVSPTLGDYIARRRRWSNGHNQSFFSHIKSFLKSPLLNVKRKTTLLFHGIFYLIPVLAVLLINIFQWYTLVQYPKNISLIIFVFGILATLTVSYVLVRLYNRFVSDSLISFWWVFPVCVTLSLFVIEFIGFEFYHFLVSFPYIDDVFGYIQLVILLIPLLILLVGVRKIKLFNTKQIVLLIVSYPLIIFFDIYAILLGFFDYLFGVRVWRKINRNVVSRKKIKNLLKKIIIFMCLLGVSLLIVIFPANNCGTDNNLFVKKIYQIIDSDTPTWETSLSRYVDEDTNELVLDFSGNFISTDGNNIQSLELLIEEKEYLVDVDENANYTFTHRVPFGFDSHEALFKSPTLGCERVIPYTNTLKEIRGSEIFVNNEPFIVKGIAPNFGQPHLGIDSGSGIKQIQSIGANLVRTYYRPDTSYLDILNREKIFFIPQSAKSNWDKLKGPFKWRSLYREYLGLVEKFSTEPFALALSFGNELEIKNKEFIKNIDETLIEIKNKNLDGLNIYATFFPYINYSSDILGINMLDTGSVYWDKMIPLLPTFEKPFVATELGGFEAFFETTDPRIRSLRLIDQWNTLMDTGASGAIIFQSHDNWAQPVVEGINNPFTPDHPDDLRGLWDYENKEKFILETVRALFEDMNVVYLDDDIFDTENINIQFTNKRSYILKNIQLYMNEQKHTELFSLSPNESKIITFSKREFKTNSTLEARYTTHSGISQYQSISIPVIYPDPQPFIPEKHQVFLRENTDTMIRGDILADNLKIYIPSTWESIGEYQIQQKIETANTNPFKELDITNIKKDGKETDRVSGIGNYSFTINMDQEISPNSLLILEGLGTGRIELETRNTTHILEVHPYRENIISLEKYLSDLDLGEITIHFKRDFIVYLTSKPGLNEQDIIIDFQNPKLFIPKTLILEKINK